MATHTVPPADDSPEGGVRSDLGRFSMVPDWLVSRALEDSGVHREALNLWCVLWRYADRRSGRCWPSKALLAEQLGRGEKVVDRALAQLVDLGALEIHPRLQANGSPDTNLYLLRFVAPLARGFSCSTGSSSTGSSSGDAGDPSPVPAGDPSPVPAGDPSPVVSRPHPPAPLGANGRPRDLVWDAVCAVMGWDVAKLAPSHRSRVGRACRELRDAGATPEEIVHARAAWVSLWRRKGSSEPTMTLEALVKWWPSLLAEMTGRRAQVDAASRQLTESVAVSAAVDALDWSERSFADDEGGF